MRSSIRPHLGVGEQPAEVSANGSMSVTTQDSTGVSVTAQSIEEAADRLAGVIIETPLQFNKRLSDATGAQVWLKREDLQPVRSYKLRGAYNLISQLGADEQTAGVVCASAGNHGQGVAFACAQARHRNQGRRAVHHTAAEAAADAPAGRGLGRTDRPRRDLRRGCRLRADEIVATEGRTMVPAFDDPGRWPVRAPWRLRSSVSWAGWAYADRSGGWRA